MNIIKLVLVVVFLFSIPPLSYSAATQDSIAVSVEPSAGLLIQNVNILSFKGKSPKIKSDKSVWVKDGKIIKISSRIKHDKIPGVKVIDGSGKFLVPGLVDAHVHIWDTPELSANLAYGITTVRNVSGMPFHLAYAKQIAEGTLTGPRLLTTGPILNSDGPNVQPNHKIVNNAEEARLAVQQQYDAGYRHLKVYSNLSREAYEAILMKARELGMSITGHTPEGLRDKGIPKEKPFNIAFSELLDDGFTSIEHMESIVWHGLYDDLDEEKIREVAKKIARSKTAVTPTLTAHHNLVMVANMKSRYLTRDGVEYLNPFISEIEGSLFDFWAKQEAGTREDFDNFFLKATKIFQDEGVVLLAGSDSGIFTNIPGLSLLDELNLMVQGGMSPYEAIKTATYNPALVLGFKKELGQVKKGFLADLLLLNKNPLLDIQNLRDISGIVVAGRWIDEAGIAQLKQQAKNVSYDRTMQQVYKGLESQGTVLGQ